MAKKARSGPMMEMLNRLTSFTSDGHAEFQTIFFEEEAILNHPIETWPTCEALIAFYSDGFPLRKVQQYAALRKPVVLNDLKKQEMLFDRRLVYRTLEECGVPVPTYTVFNAEDASDTGNRQKQSKAAQRRAARHHQPSAAVTSLSLSLSLCCASSRGRGGGLPRDQQGPHRQTLSREAHLRRGPQYLYLLSEVAWRRLEAVVP